MAPSLFSKIQPARAILISVAVFVVLDLSILFVNYRMAHQLDQDTVAINLAGRQRMLSQRIGMLALEQRVVPESSPQWQQINAELKKATQLFDQTLKAFLYGGYVEDTQGKTIYFAAREDSDIQQRLRAADGLWRNYQLALERFSLDVDIGSHELKISEQLLLAVNDLTFMMETAAHRKANNLRLFQSIAVLFVLINFLIVLWQVKRRFNSVSNNNEMLRRLVDRVPTAVLLFDNQNRVRFVNEAAEKLFDQSAIKLLDSRFDELLHERGGVWYGVRLHDRSFTASVEIGQLVFDGSPMKLVNVMELSKQEASRERWRHLANHDLLTGLPNRRALEERLQQEFAAARRHDEVVAILTIDLDGFKGINDTFGHQAGDEVLYQTANRLREAVREEDFVARLGGDEFIVVLNRLPASHGAASIVQSITHNLLNSIRQPIIAGGELVEVGSSIGVGFFPSDGNSLEEVMQQSDASMYRAKSTGIGCEVLQSGSQQH